jgi:site-specific recombinase XerD
MTESTALSRIEHADALDYIKALVLDSVTSPLTRLAYSKALDEFLAWCPGRKFTKATVNEYRATLEARHLAPSSINQKLSAVRKLAAEAADDGLIDLHLAAGIARVHGAKLQGVRTGNWLTKQQAERLVNAPDVETLKGKRDRAMLALMIGCGLRRNEVAKLAFEHIQMREARWVIVDMMGKHGHVRSVPMPAFAKAAIDVWTQAARLSTGRLFRGVNKGDNLTGDSLDPQGVWRVVEKYREEIGVPLAPHDLRRTFAKLAHRGRAALEQIQLSLGHASIQTTERYLGVQQDLTDAPCDHLGLRLSGL